MRTNVTGWIAATLLLLCAQGAAESTPMSPNDPALLGVMAEIPECGMNCLLQEIPSIGCGLLDISCQCSSTNSTDILQPCLLANCTYEETFKLLKVQGVLCDKPHNNRAMAVRITGWVSAIVPIVAVTMRFSSRYIGGSKFWWDDWLQLIAVVLAVPASAMLIMNSYSGLGYHIWDVTYQDVVNVGRYTYIATLLWATNLLLLKFSILTLYLRIFPNPWLRHFIAYFSAFSLLYTIPLILLAAFQCVPIHAIWDLSAQSSAKCIDWIAVLRATVIFEVIAEVVLFVLPIPVVLRLQMPRGKKVLLIVFFGLGTGIIGISCARLPFLSGVTDTADQTWTVVPTGVLGFGASIAGHVCAAVPTVRALQRAVGKVLWKVLCCGEERGTEGSSRPSRFGGRSGGSGDGSGSGDSKGKLSSASSASQTGGQAGGGKAREKGKHSVTARESGQGDEERDIPLAALRPTVDRGRLSQALFSRPWNPNRETARSFEPALYRDAWGNDGQSDRVSDADSLLSNQKRAEREGE